MARLCLAAQPGVWPLRGVLKGESPGPVHFTLCAMPPIFVKLPFSHPSQEKTRGSWLTLIRGVRLAVFPSVPPFSDFFSSSRFSASCSPHGPVVVRRMQCFLCHCSYFFFFTSAAAALGLPWSQAARLCRVLLRNGGRHLPLDSLPFGSRATLRSQGLPRFLSTPCVDLGRNLWGFCPVSVFVAADCGLAGNCIDRHACSRGC